jgi:hypothetical protein
LRVELSNPTQEKGYTMTTKKDTGSDKAKIVRVRRRGPGSLGETVAKWKQLASNTRLLLTDASSQVAADLARFEELIAKVEGSMAEQNVLSGRATILVQQRKLDVADTRVVRNRMVAHVQSRLGPESEQLREFGLKPRQQKTRPRVPQPGEPEEPEAPEQPVK